jgi:hypothetical protein
MLSHITPDADGLYGGFIVPKLHANYLFYTCHASLITGLYGLYRGNQLAVYPLSVYIASINYWRHPVNGLRRYTDMACAGICIVSQTMDARLYPNFANYLTTMFVGTMFYPLSFYFQYKYLPLSTFSHSLIHIVCNIANYLLYSN